MAQETVVTQHWGHRTFRKYLGNTLHRNCSDCQLFLTFRKVSFKNSNIYYVTDIFCYLVPRISTQNACETKNQIIPLLCQWRLKWLSALLNRFQQDIINELLLVFWLKIGRINIVILICTSAQPISYILCKFYSTRQMIQLKYFTDVNTLGSQCVHSILWLNL